MVWSEISFSRALQEQRFGPEFWRPEYLSVLTTSNNWTPIGDLLVRCQYGISREMNEESVGVPIYRMNEMDGLFLTIPHKFVNVSPLEHDEFRLSVGDVLFNRTNSYKFVGRTGILKEPSDAVFASYLIRLTPDESRLLPEFLTVYLNCPTGVAQIKRRAMESINQTNVSGSEIRAVPIPLLPMAFQRRIAEIVDRAAQARSAGLAAHKKAETQLLDELKFLDFQYPETQHTVRTFSDTVFAGRWDAEYFRPAYWQIRSVCQSYSGGCLQLGEIAQSITNGVESRVFVEDGAPYIRVGDMRTLRIDSRSAEKIPMTESHSLLPKVRLKVGDVLAARSGSIGQAAVVLASDLNSVISSHLMRIRLRDDAPIHGTYLALFLSTLPGVEQVFMNGNGGIVPEISQPNLRKVLIPVPPPKWQTRVAQLISEAHHQEDSAFELMREATDILEERLR